MDSISPSRFSLVVATLGRTTELERLFLSLCAQERRDVEVLVVDQNRDARLEDGIARFRDRLAIVYIRTEFPGVCRARNLGARRASGEWLLFPDDDCWYPPGFFLTLERIMDAVPADLYGGRPTDMDGRTIMGTFAPAPVRMTRDTVWNTLMEWLVLVRRCRFEEAGGFDERIGPGSGTVWGAHEIQDLVLKCLENGAKGHYDPTLNAHHPEDRQDQATAENIAKMYRYAAGFGYVMRRHDFPISVFLPHLLRPAAGIAVHGCTGRWGMARRSMNILSGRIEGWRTAPKRHVGPPHSIS